MVPKFGSSSSAYMKNWVRYHNRNSIENLCYKFATFAKAETVKSLLMRHLAPILTILLLFSACTNTTREKANNNATFQVNDKVKMEQFSDPIFQSDSVTIAVKHDHLKFSVILTIGNNKRVYDLTELGIPTKSPDEVLWANSEYACMMTWWSQAQSRHIFIPTRGTNEFIYIDKVIEEMDSIHNNVVYVDSVYENAHKVVFKVENLLTRKSKALELTINAQNSTFPFFDEIILTKNKLTITTALEKKSMDIEGINKGL